VPTRTHRRPRRKLPHVTLDPQWNGQRWINVPVYQEMICFANIRRPSEPWPPRIRNFAAATDLVEAKVLHGRTVICYPRASDDDAECDDALLVVQDIVRHMLDLLIVIGQRRARRASPPSEPFTPMQLSIASERAKTIHSKLVSRYADAPEDLSRVADAGWLHIRRCRCQCGRYFLTTHGGTVFYEAQCRWDFNNTRRDKAARNQTERDNRAYKKSVRRKKVCSIH
jgi:hypothetical protein